MFWNNVSAIEHQFSTQAPLCLQTIACSIYVNIYIYMHTREHCMAYPTVPHGQDQTTVL